MDFDLIQKEGKAIRRWAIPLQTNFDYHDLCGFCAVCSLKLYLRLQELNIESHLVTSRRHCWLEIGDYIVDVTAKQYNKKFPAVLIKRKYDQNIENYWDNGQYGLEEHIEEMKKWPEWEQPATYNVFI